METGKIRLHKLMADRGIASRRKSEELIAAGKVKVNGIRVKEMGIKIDLLNDAVSYQGALINNPKKKQLMMARKMTKKGPKIGSEEGTVEQNEDLILDEFGEIDEDKHIYIVLNKPVGFVTTVHDENGRKTVMELVDDVEQKLGVKRIFPVGRLDQDTSGLLFLTNDGDWANKVTHPRYEVEKTYIAVCMGGEWTANEITRFTSGLRLGSRAEKLTAPAQWRQIDRHGDGSRKIEIKVTEGQNRQVRRMCQAVNHRVIKLERVATGSVKLGALKRGKWRELTEHEVKSLVEGAETV